MKTFYLAHAASKMDEIREWQLEFQKRNPRIRFHNPFFEGKEAPEIQKVKQGVITRQQHILRSNWKEYVDDDIASVFASDGVVCNFWDEGAHSIGTPCEMMWAFIFHKPIYVIADGFRSENHWFIKYTGAQIFTSRKKFEEFIAEQYEYEGIYA